MTSNEKVKDKKSIFNMEFFSIIFSIFFDNQGIFSLLSSFHSHTNMLNRRKNVTSGGGVPTTRRIEHFESFQEGNFKNYEKNFFSIE
jgi:hypothetical protein